MVLLGAAGVWCDGAGLSPGGRGAVGVTLLGGGLVRATFRGPETSRRRGVQSGARACCATGVGILFILLRVMSRVALADFLGLIE